PGHGGRRGRAGHSAKPTADPAVPAPAGCGGAGRPQTGADMTPETKRKAKPRPATEDGAIRLRPMRKADLDVLLPHERAMFGTESWSRDSYLDELADTELRHYLVAEDEAGQVLASAGLLTIAETAQILTIGVLPPARRRGIARLLVRALLAEARRRQAHEVLLEVRMDNKPARKLYE